MARRISCVVLQREILRILGPDSPAHLGHPCEPLLLMLLRGKGGAAAEVAEDHRGPDKLNKKIC